MNPLRLLLCSALVLFLAGCGAKKIAPLGPAAAVEWTELVELDSALAHAIDSDAAELALAAKALDAPPAGISNAALVSTMMGDLKQLGSDLETVDEKDRTEMITAMHAVVGKMLSEAGIDAHQCEIHGHGHDNHGADGADAHGADGDDAGE